MSLQWPAAESGLAFVRLVEATCGHDLRRCYQCGKCTAGCPGAPEMDYPPHQLIRGVQLGLEHTVLSSRTIWLCAACETCSARCPQDVDPAGVMDALRQIAYARRTESPEADVPLFHRIFVASIQRLGRVHEVSLIVLFNMFSGRFFKDVLLVPVMLSRKKLALLRPRRRVRSARELFARVREIEGNAR